MHSLNMIIMIILIACFLPYIFNMIARYSSGYDAKIHGDLRQYLNTVTGLAARAYAVERNSFEGLPLFLAAILIADYLVVPDSLILRLGLSYLVLRVLYGVFALANWVTMRSVLWVLSTLCPVLLLLICIRL